MEDGSVKTIHCPNTGSMKACLSEGSDCWFSVSDNPKRKYPETWEVATTPAGHLAGINTGRANALVKEAIESGVIAELKGYATIRPEVKYGEENSRIDFLLSDDSRGDCYVEVKNVTLYEGDGWGAFPDAVSTRGAKHLRELSAVCAEGGRAVLVYCVQHTGIERVRAAAKIDPEYANELKTAQERGVEVLAYGAVIQPEEILLMRSLPVELG